jgi:hypothetical protein
VSYDGTLSVAGTGFGNDNGQILFFNQNKTDTTELQPITGYMKKELGTPLQQFKSGVTTQNITCKEGFVLAIKKQGPGQHV